MSAKNDDEMDVFARAGKFLGSVKRLEKWSATDGKTVWSWHPLLVSSRRRCCAPNRVAQDR